MSKGIEVEEGNSNIFADIGLPNPERRLAKADLAIYITETIRAPRLTQTRAAHVLKVDQSKIGNRQIPKEHGLAGADAIIHMRRWNRHRRIHFFSLPYETPVVGSPKVIRNGQISFSDFSWLGAHSPLLFERLLQAGNYSIDRTLPK